MNRRVVVALSGGVDSAAALYMLQRHQVAHPNCIECLDAVYFNVWQGEDSESWTRCKSDQAFALAESVAKKLGVKLHRLNLESNYWNDVWMPTVQAYSLHHTPNPDILCNMRVKFGPTLWQWIASKHGDCLATGHYARKTSNLMESNDMEEIASTCPFDESDGLYRARDLAKDQSYFLAGLLPSQLAKAIFPCGLLPSKSLVRALALREWPEVLKEKSSKGICFVHPRSFARLLSDHSPCTSSSKDIRCVEVDSGRLLGTLPGWQSFLTIGQCVRIKSQPARYYVLQRLQIDSGLEYICTIREDARLYARSIVASEFTSKVSHLTDNLECIVRSTDRKGAPCRVRTIDNHTVIKLDEPVWAPAPGQWAVLYCRSTQRLVASGIISSYTS